MSPFEAYTRRRDVTLASIDALALLSYIVDSCSHGNSVTTAELCGVAKDLGLMFERPMRRDENIEGTLPGETICAFADSLLSALTIGRQRISERYRADKN